MGRLGHIGPDKSGRPSLISATTDLHAWDLSPGEARALQETLRHKVVKNDVVGSVNFVAGVDVGFEDGGNTVRAAVVLLRFPDLRVQEEIVARAPNQFPYIPGLLSFRELPGVIKALQQLHTDPDLILCDGQGYAHPRRFGLACHLGLLTDTPTIGIGKSRLIGTYTEPGPQKGDWSPLVDADEVIGAVLRTRSQVKPVFVSVGHRISLNTAIRYALACTTRFKLPQTTRLADRLASQR